jgi:hypothetical protein
VRRETDEEGDGDGEEATLGAFAGRFNSVHLIGNPHSLSSTDELVRFKEDVQASVLVSSGVGSSGVGSSGVESRLGRSGSGNVLVAVDGHSFTGLTLTDNVTRRSCAPTPR